MEIQQWKLYTATVRLRRGEQWHVKPECEAIDGRRVLVLASGIIDDGIYEGERYMDVEAPKDFPVGWIASGDLTRLELHPRG